VTEMPFDTSAADRAKEDLATAEADETRDQIMSIAKTSALALVVGIVLLLAWRASRRTRRNEVTLAELARLDTDAAATALTGRDRMPELDGRGDDETAALAAGPADPAAPAELEQRSTRPEDIAQIVNRQPEEVAQILRAWLAERKA
jgi:flagellar M-ring protein FliF